MGTATSRVECSLSEINQLEFNVSDTREFILIHRPDIANPLYRIIPSDQFKNSGGYKVEELPHKIKVKVRLFYVFVSIGNTYPTIRADVYDATSELFESNVDVVEFYDYIPWLMWFDDHKSPIHRKKYKAEYQGMMLRKEFI